MKFQKILFLFGMLTTTSLTVYGQSTSKDTLQGNKGVYYTSEMDKAAIECWKNSEKRDSLLILANETLKKMKFRNDVLVTEKEAVSRKAFELSELLEQEKKRSSRRGKAAVIGFGSAIGLLIFSIITK